MKVFYNTTMKHFFSSEILIVPSICVMDFCNVPTILIYFL